MLCSQPEAVTPKNRQPSFQQPPSTTSNWMSRLFDSATPGELSTALLPHGPTSTYYLVAPSLVFFSLLTEFLPHLGPKIWFSVIKHASYSVVTAYPYMRFWILIFERKLFLFFIQDTLSLSRTLLVQWEPGLCNSRREVHLRLERQGFDSVFFLNLLQLKGQFT